MERPSRAEGFGDLCFFSSNVDWRKMREAFLSVEWRVLMGDDPNENLGVLLDVVLQICRDFVPLRKPKRSGKGIPRHRRVLMRKRAKLNKRISRSNNERHKQILRDQMLTAEDQLKKSHDIERKTHERKAVAAIRRNPSYFYKYVKTRSTVKPSVGPLLSNGQLVSSPSEVSQTLSCQYQSVFSTPKESSAVEDTREFFSTACDGPMLDNVEFDQTDIEAAMRELNSGSAAGPDQFPAILLTRCAAELRLPLFLLWQSSMKAGLVPHELKRANIVPIFKGGAPEVPKNYRPVALTSNIIKVFEKVVSKRLIAYLNDNALFNSGQHGFRAGRSCLSQLLQHRAEVIDAFENGSNMESVYLDFSKAFDIVDHGILLHKLRGLGVRGRLGCWLASFLTNRVQCVVVDGAKSSEERVVSGVPQGTVLGPLLFLIMISDIDQDVTYSSVTSFADDTRVARSITCEDDVKKLQSDLDSIYEWAEANNMTFNSDKFEAIRYRSGALEIDGNYSAPQGDPILFTDNVKDLGIITSNDGSFSDHIVTIVKRARRKVGLIWRMFETREEECMITLYKSLVIPILEYGCQLWCPSSVGEIQQIESVQRSFTSRIMGVAHLNYWDRLKSLRLYSLERRRERYIVIYIWKMIESLVPNVGVQTKYNARRGRLCVVAYANNRARATVQNIKNCFLTVRGAKLFNALPRTVRDLSKVTLNIFKNRLDVFLGTLPDQPATPHYHRRAPTNSIVDQAALLRADGCRGLRERGRDAPLGLGPSAAS